MALLTANKHPHASNPIFKNTKIALLRIDRSLEISIKGSKLESLWANSKIKYRVKHLLLDAWIEKGISHPTQLEEEGYRTTFSTLKPRYNLPDKEFYNFLKTRTALTEAKLSSPNLSITQYMGDINRLGNQASRLYKLLRPTTTKRNEKLTNYWTKDNNISLSDQEIATFWSSVSRNKICQVLSQTKFWLLHKAIWTPSRLFTLGLRENDLCCNCEKEKGDLACLIFYCPTIKGFWEKVFALIKKTLGCTLIPAFVSLTTAFITSELDSQQDGDLLDLLLISAMKMVLNNWKGTSKTTYKGWVNWVTYLRGADNMALQNSPWKPASRGMWESLDTYLDTYEPP